MAVAPPDPAPRAGVIPRPAPETPRAAARPRPQPSQPGNSGRPGRPARRRVGRFPWAGPVLLVATAVVALLIGSGVLSDHPTTVADRAMAIESQVRCPSCQDISVGQSAAPTAVAVRHQITGWVAQGHSEQWIDNQLVARYGLSILLQPPTSGLSAVVWVLPAVLGAVALGSLGVLFWRRSREMTELSGRDRS